MDKLAKALSLITLIGCGSRAQDIAPSPFTPPTPSSPPPPTSFSFVSQAPRPFPKQTVSGNIDCILLRETNYTGSSPLMTTNMCKGFEADESISTLTSTPISQEVITELDRALKRLSLDDLKSEYVAEFLVASMSDGSTYKITFRSSSTEQSVFVDTSDSTILPDGLREIHQILRSF